MNWGKIDPTRKPAPMHSADTEVDLFQGQAPSRSGIDDLDEEEINRLLETLEKEFGGAGTPTQAD
jgi:hypothetical protein